MNKLIKRLIIGALTVSLIFIGFIGYVSIKVNQEVTDLGIRIIQNQIGYLNEQQIRDNIDNSVKFLQFKNKQIKTNEKNLRTFDTFRFLQENNIRIFDLIFEELKEPDIDLLLKSSVIVQTPTRNGSGTVIKKYNGFTYILTCYHVIEEKPPVVIEEKDEEREEEQKEEEKKEYKNPFIIKEAIDPPEESQTNITVSYLLRNERSEEIGNVIYIAEIVGYDEEKDLALLKIFGEDENLNVVSIAKEEPKIGDTVYSIGNPLSTNRTLSKGILSTKEEDFYISDNTITFGNSGGGLFNNKGELIGVPSNVMAYFFGNPESSLGLSRDLSTIIDFLKGVDY